MVRKSGSEVNASNRSEAGERTALLPLTPSYDNTDHRVYYDALESALSGDYSKGIRNIALTGSYGVGKSSILQKIAEQYHDRVVQISLSTLGFSDEPVDAGPQQAKPLSTTNLIQKEIVKQLLYRENPARTPGSRFRRIGGFQFWRELGIALLAGFVIALVFYLTGWSVQLAELGRPDLKPGIGIQTVVLVAASLFVLAVRALSHNRIRIEKVSAGAATISLSQESTSFFDQYLDEIVYFFDATRHDIVIFEDIDRFDDPHIFETLRALNTLLNGAKQLRSRNIRFIYAIKDSIFDELGTRGTHQEDNRDSSDKHDTAQLALARANRTKFFDLVIPVVPFITHRSARDLMTKLMGGLEHRVSPELIDLAARHVPDMRLLKNIRNEFVIFSQKVLARDPGGLDLNPDSLFAMILYKSTHLSDFETVRTGSSNLDTLYQSGRDLVSQNIARLNAEARNARRQLAAIDSAADRSKTLGGALIDYIDRVVRHLGGTIVSQTFDNVTIEPEGFRSLRFWQKLASSGSPLIVGIRSGYQQHQLTFTRADLSAAIGDPISPQAWQDSERASLQEQLSSNSKQRDFLARADMDDLMTGERFTVKHRDGTEKSFRQLASDYLGSELARQLVEAGHINRDFTLYTSTYHVDRVSSQAMNFIMHNVDPNIMDAHFELTDGDVEAVIRERGESTLRERGMYNISVLDHLLGKDDPSADLLVASLQLYGEDQQSFLQAYLADGREKGALIRKLARWWRVLTFIVSEVEVDDNARVDLLNVALESAATDVQYRVDSNFRDYLQDNYADLQVFISTSTSAETAARIADLLESAGVSLSALAPLADTVRRAVVAKRRYEVSRDNLVLALAGEEDLALDFIRGRDLLVYDHVLTNMSSYLAGFVGDDKWPHTIRTNAEFVDILTGVLEVDDSHLEAIVDSASAECRVVDLNAIAQTAWPALAKSRRFPVTSSNVKAYIDAMGAIDEYLAAHIASAREIEAAGMDDASKSVLAEKVLAARDVLPQPELRVDLVVSLDLKDWLPAESVEAEPGHLIGLLIENRIIADNAESFALKLATDWGTREFAISKSDKFTSYMTPAEVSFRDITPLLRSKLISPEVKSEILRRLSEFGTSASQETLTVVAEYAVATEFKLSLEDVSRIANVRVATTLVLRLLEPLLAELTLAEVASVLRSLGGEYPQLIERNGKRPNLPDTASDRALVHRLKQLGTVSTMKPSGGKLQINMKRR